MQINKCDNCRHSRRCPESSKRIGPTARVIQCDNWKIRKDKKHGQRKEKAQ